MRHQKLEAREARGHVPTWAREPCESRSQEQSGAPFHVWCVRGTAGLTVPVNQTQRAGSPASATAHARPSPRATGDRDLCLLPEVTIKLPVKNSSGGRARAQRPGFSGRGESELENRRLALAPSWKDTRMLSRQTSVRQPLPLLKGRAAMSSHRATQPPWGSNPQHFQGKLERNKASKPGKIKPVIYM